MGVRRVGLGGGGVGGSEGVSREDVQIEEKDLEQEEGVSRSLRLMELGLSLSVSSSSSRYPLTGPSLHCLPPQALSSPQPLICVPSLSVGLQRWLLS